MQVADFATLVGTYAKGFAIIIEPYDERMPSVPDPVIEVWLMSHKVPILPFSSTPLTSSAVRAVTGIADCS